jgi:hypothetical protein
MAELTDLPRRQAPDRAIDVKYRFANGRIVCGHSLRERVCQHHRRNGRYHGRSVGVERVELERPLRPWTRPVASDAKRRNAKRTGKNESPSRNAHVGESSIVTCSNYRECVEQTI